MRRGLVEDLFATEDAAARFAALLADGYIELVKQGSRLLKGRKMRFDKGLCCVVHACSQFGVSHSVEVTQKFHIKDVPFSEGRGTTFLAPLPQGLAVKRPIADDGPIAGAARHLFFGRREALEHGQPARHLSALVQQLFVDREGVVVGVGKDFVFNAENKTVGGQHNVQTLGAFTFDIHRRFPLNLNVAPVHLSNAVCYRVWRQALHQGFGQPRRNITTAAHENGHHVRDRVFGKSTPARLEEVEFRDWPTGEAVQLGQQLCQC